MRSLRVIANLLISLIATIALSAVAKADTSFLLGNSPHKHHTLQDIQKISQSNEVFGALFNSAYSQSFRPLTNSWGDDQLRQLKILPLSQDVATKQVLEFVLALENEKQNLMRIYKLRNATYNKLAAMALGIFGNESEFGSSFRLAFKERFQDVVVLGKFLKGQKDLTTSRGVTQIKDLPEKIVQNYGVTPDSLIIPLNAAVSTVGYLAETFSMLLSRKDLNFINADNVFDYMPYVYSGQMGKLLNHTATVVDNSYVIHMKQNIRKFYFMENQ